MSFLIAIANRLSHAILVVFMTLVIVLAVLTSLLRYYMPQADQYREKILHLISEQTGLTINASKLDAKWQSFRPDLRLENIVLNRDDDSYRVTLDYLQIEINIIKTLINGRLHIDTLVLDNLDIRLKQHQDGQWFVSAGEESKGEKKINVDALIDYFWSVDSLMLRDVRLQMQPYGKESVVFPEVSLSLFSWLNEKVLLLEIVEKQNLLSRLILQANNRYGEDDFSAQLYWQASSFPVHILLSAFNSLDVANESLVSHELWLQWQNGELTGSGEFSLDKLLFRQGEQDWLAEAVAGQFYVETVNKHFVLAVPKLQADINQQHVALTKLKLLKGERWGLQAQALDLTALTDFLRIIPLRGDLAELRDQLHPSGILRDIQLDIVENDIALEATLDNVSVGAWKGAPALTNVSGYIKASKLAGFVQLNSQDFAMAFPKLFHYPMQFDQAKGTVFWHVDEEEIRVGSHKLLSLSGDYGQAIGEFQLTIPRVIEDEDDIGRISIVVSLDNGDVQYKKYLIPFTVDKGLQDWLDKNVHDGFVKRGNFIYHGPLISAAQEIKVVQLWLDIENGHISYAEGFPAVHNVAGEFLLDQTDAIAKVTNASILGLPVHDARVELVIGQENRSVQVSGRLQNAPSSTIMDFLQSAAVRKVSANVLYGWQSYQGFADATVHVNVPLQHIEQLNVQVDAVLKDIDLLLSKQELAIHHINGDLSFDLKKGFAAKKLTGELWGEAINASINGKKGDTLEFNSRINHQGLSQWLKLPELNFLNGEMNINGTVSWAKSHSAIHINSTMQGMALELPEPLGKKADAQRNIQLDLPLTGEKRELKIASDDGLSLQFMLGDKGLEAGLLTLGLSNNEYRSGYLVARGHLYQANVQQWIDVVNRYNTFRERAIKREQSNPLIVHVDGIQIRDLDLFGVEMSNARFSAIDKVTGWQLSLQQQHLTGSVTVNHKPDVPMLVDIENIDLQEIFQKTSDIKSDKSAWSADALPDIDVMVRNIRAKENNYGSARFALRSDGNVLRFNDINAVIHQLEFGQLSETSPCVLQWHLTDAPSTDFNCRIRSKAVDQALVGFNLPPMVVSESLALDVNAGKWQGSPADFSLMTSYLPLTVRLDNGYFAEVDSTATDALKIISVLNISNLVRRVKLDFSDLTQKGLTFDRVRGQLLFDNGVVKSKSPLMIYGSSSQIRMAGTGDFNQDLLDVEMTLSLPLASNLPWVVALAAGLPAAAGVFIISKILGKQVNKLSSAVYSIKGPMQNPETRFERFFDIGGGKQEDLDVVQNQEAVQE